MKNIDRITTGAKTQSKPAFSGGGGLKALSKLAFTLAEVLIVLGIIGIIADMTIPTLKRDIDKIVFVTQLKKFYSTFQQGLQTILIAKSPKVHRGLRMVPAVRRG